MQTYAVITPARDETENLVRLARCMVAQSVRPTKWLIVDNGSRDGSLELAKELARTHAWIDFVEAEPVDRARPGAPIVRAFNAGLERLGALPDVVVKLDADISMDSDYFERVLAAFAADPELGIAGGACYELRDGSWEETYVTGDHVRGASRCYRRECLEAVAPIEERVGWDGIDELKATVLGWRTRLLRDLPFYHHRRVGERDGGLLARWLQQGEAAHYMGYRFSYIVLRSLHHGLRRPAALAMIWGYAFAAARRADRCGDEGVRSYLREQQRARRLPLRLREALGRRA